MSTFSVADMARGLQAASDDMKREVGALIPVAADQMVSTLERRYPLGTKPHPSVPHMRDDIRTRTRPTNDFLLPARQVIGPRLTYIWQDGTVTRRDSTRGGANRGRMPAADPAFFERTAVQIRAQMMARAQDVLNRPRTIT